MRNLLFIVSIILVLKQVITQSCQTIVGNQKIFLTTTENLFLDLNEIFQGQNLSYSSSNTLTSVYNYATPVDNGNTLPAGIKFIQNAIYSQQSNGQWKGQTAFLATNTYQGFVVYSSDFTNSTTPKFTDKSITTLLRNPQKCIGITYTSSRYVIVDCYNVTNDLLVNFWQIVYTEKSYGYDTVSSSNNQSIKSRVLGFGRVIRFFSNKTSGNEYLYRATLNGQGGPSALEIFQVKSSYYPSLYPFVTLNSSNITNLQIVDIEITPDGTLYVLNQTNVLIAYTLDENHGTLNEQATIILNPRVSYLAIDIRIDFKFTTSGGYSILLATTSVDNNIEEWIVIGNQTAVQSGFYTVPAQLTYTGIPTQMDIYNKRIVVQDKQIVYVFERGVADFLNQKFKQSQVLFSIRGIYAKMNTNVEALLVFTSSRVQLSLLKAPAIVIKKISKSGSITLTATTYLENAQPVICTATVIYELILASNSSILQTVRKLLPITAIFPFNQTFDISKNFSGPLINFTGRVTEESQSLISTIVDTTLTQFIINVEGYPTQGIVFAQNSYDQATDILLQFVQTSQKLTAYLCNGVTLDNYSDCSLIGTLKQTYIISKLAIMYLNKLNPNAFLIIPSSINSLDIYEVSWTQKGSIKSLYTSISTTKSGPITDFTVLGDRLYVVLNSINEIWVYSISNNSANRLNQITYRDFSFYGFQPIGIVGNFQTYGPTIFIDNQIQALIVSTAGDQISLVATITYPLAQPDMSTIKLVGSDLILVQISGGYYPQQFITQYNLNNLTNPVIVKTLPLYGGVPVSPLIIASDSNFLYVVLENNVLNIYKPSAPQHETLYRQIAYPNNIQINFVSGISKGSNSYILIVNRDKIISYRLNRKPILTFVSGKYYNQYYSLETFTLTLTNSLGSEPIVVNQNISIFNPQQQIKIDPKKFNSSNNKIVVTQKGLSILYLDPRKYIDGPVANHRTECEYCRVGQINLINQLMPRSQQIGKHKELREINAMTNYPGQGLTFVSNKRGIYTVSIYNEVKQVVFGYKDPMNKCNVLSLDEKRTTLLSVCEVNMDALELDSPPQSYISTMDLTTNYRIIHDHRTDIIGVIKANLLGQTGFFLGNNLESNSQPTINIFINNTHTYSQFLTCDDATNNGVNDYSLTAIQNILGRTIPRTNKTIYILMWTCQLPGLGVQYTTFIIDEFTQIIGAVQPQQTLDTSIQFQILQDLTFPLLADNTFQQIRTLTTSKTQKKTNLNIVLTTDNFINLILQISFSFDETLATLTSTRLVTFLPSYGNWASLNSLDYSSGLLAIPYTQDDQNFLAVYNLNDLDYDKTHKSPNQMIGGFYQDVSFTNQWIFNIQESQGETTQILTVCPNIYSLSSYSFNSQLQILVNSTPPYAEQIITFIAENDYSSQNYTVRLNYNFNDNNDIKWWGWALIVIFTLLAAGFIVTVSVRCMQLREKRNNRLFID